MNYRIVSALLLALAALASSPGLTQDRVPVGELRKQTHIHGLAVDPQDPSRLFIATHHGLFVADRSGQARCVSEVQDLMGFTPHPADRKALYASGHPAGGGNLGIVASNDGGATWRQISPGADGPVDFHQMTISPADPNVMYGAYGYLQVSRDGGETWEKVGRAPPGLIDVAASALDPDRLYAATEAGLLVSRDGGRNWQPQAFEGEAVSMVEAAHGTLYAAVVGRGLMAADDVAEPNWRKLAEAPGSGIILHLAAGPSGSNQLYAADHGSILLASSDGGQSWTRFVQSP